MIINSESELRDWVASTLPDWESGVEIVTAALASSSHPPYGEDWEEFLSDNRVWLLCHTGLRVRQAGLESRLRYSPHGRGVRITDEEGLDVIAFSFDEVDHIVSDEYVKHG